MKRIIIVYALTLISTIVISQPVNNTNYLTWSDATTFKTSPPPAIVGYGELSSSLNKELGNIYYVFGDEYFKVDTWASYYYWFTQKYFYLFQNPEEYEYYYNAKNDKEMVRYIAQNYMAGIPLPSKIDFSGLNLVDTKMSYAVNEVKVNELKSFIKKSYSKEEELNYLARRKEIKTQNKKNKEIDNYSKESKAETSYKSNPNYTTKSKTNRNGKDLKKN